MTPTGNQKDANRSQFNFSIALAVALGLIGCLTLVILFLALFGGIWLDEIADSGCDVVGLDWTVNLGQARAQVGHRVALQGNLDPNVLFAPPAQVAAQARAVLDSFGTPHTDKTTTGPTHIFNLGHGISQFTPPEHVSALVEAVHSHSRAQRQG